MSVTCCPLSGADGDCMPSCFTRKTRTARKEHECCECADGIKVGDRYEFVSGIWDGRPDVYKTCLSCREIRNHFACDGYVYGQLWSDLEENMFPDMRAGGPCLEGLSPAAKRRLFDARLKWLEESDGRDHMMRHCALPPSRNEEWREQAMDKADELICAAIFARGRNEEHGEEVGRG